MSEIKRGGELMRVEDMEEVNDPEYNMKAKLNKCRLI